MAGQRKPPSFAVAKPGGKGAQPSFPKPPQRPTAKGAKAKPRAQAIPDAVANRMARRIAIATGVPSVMGMGVFVGSYLLVSRQILDIPPGTVRSRIARGRAQLVAALGNSEALDERQSES